MRSFLAILCVTFWAGVGVSYVNLRKAKDDLRQQKEVIEARAAVIEEKADLCDKVVLTCLSQQTVVKYALESLYAMVRTNCK